MFHLSNGRPSPLQGEVIVALGLGGDVLPQLVGRQAGPRRVVATAGDPVATLAALAATHKLVGRQVGDGVREGAQEAVEEMAHGGRESRQLHTLHGEGKKGKKHTKTLVGTPLEEAGSCRSDGTNLEVGLKDVFSTSGDQLADSYSLK